MRFVRLLVISVVILFLLVTAISLLIPFTIRISRATNVKAPPAAIWQQIDDMHQWKEWNPFFSNLPQDRIRFLDTAAGKPAGMEVNGTVVRWKEIKSDERIADMQKTGHQTILSGWKCINQPAGDSTTVQWYMDFKLRWYPWEKFSSLLFEKSYGLKMEQGLNNIKKRAEADRTSIN
jgi:hypothetical protein